MDIEFIRELIGLLDNTDITEFELEWNTNRVKLKRNCRSSVPVSPDAQSAYSEAVQTESCDSAVVESADAEEEGNGHVVITSPMVGTFYRAPAPDAEPFVDIGDLVRPGQTVCIIEAMKLMNEIEADIKGRIVDILIENAEPVEYGEPLFVIDPHAV